MLIKTSHISKPHHVPTSKAMSAEPEIQEPRDVYWPSAAIGGKPAMVVGGSVLFAAGLLGHSSRVLGPIVATVATAVIGLEVGLSKKAAAKGAALGLASSLMGAYGGVAGIALSTGLGVGVGHGLFSIGE